MNQSEHVNLLKIFQYSSFLFLFVFFILSLYLQNYLNVKYNTIETQKLLGFATCLPDQCFCEKLHLDQIVQPVNSLTNIFFLFVGIWILFQLKTWDLFSVIYSYISIFLGIGSFFYHATMTFLGMWFDVFFMYAYILFLILFLFYKANVLNKIQSIYIYIFLLTISGIFLLESPVYRRFLFGFYVILIIIVFFQIKKIKIIKPKYFYISLILFIISYTIWILDFYLIFCNKDSLIQGHGIWHTINSIVMYTLYLFFKENFKKDLYY